MHRVSNSASKPARRVKIDVVPEHTEGRRPPALESRATQAGYSRTVHHGGNRYFATAEMAEIFRTQATQIIAEGETELVPLLHSTGVDLLLIGPLTRFTVVTMDIGHHTVG